jgi:hypothetical protein
MIGCTARMRESLNIFEVLTDFIYDSAWASDHYALVRVHHYEVWKEGPLRISRTKLILVTIVPVKPGLLTK